MVNNHFLNNQTVKGRILSQTDDAVSSLFSSAGPAPADPALETEGLPEVLGW